MIIVLYFLLQGLQGKSGSKGAKGEVVSVTTKQKHILNLQLKLAPFKTNIIFFIRVTQGRLERLDPLESQVFLYVSDGLLGVSLGHLTQHGTSTL